MSETRNHPVDDPEESLARLVHDGSLDRGHAMLRAAHPEELESLLRGT
jgi:hypothetical protein